MKDRNVKAWLPLVLAVWATGASTATYVWLARPAPAVGVERPADAVSDTVAVAIEDRGKRAYLGFSAAYAFEEAPTVPIEALLSDVAIDAAQSGALSPHDPDWRAALARALARAKERLGAKELRLVKARLREHDG